MAERQANRVDLTEMGLWGKPVRVEFAGRYEEVWLQIIGDRTEAIEHGHEAMQRKLLEFRPGSERTEALTQALMLSPVEDLAELALEAERPRMEARLRRELPDPVSPRQDGLAGETREDFGRRAADHRCRCQGLARDRAQRLEEMLEARRDELRRLPQAEVVELARPRRIDVECWNAFARACDEWVLLRAVRRAEDHDQPYFDSVDQVRALHPAVREQLRQAYRELDPPDADTLPKD